VRVFGDAAVTNFHETEDTLNHVEGVLNPGPDAGFAAMDVLLTFGEAWPACRIMMREICRGRRASPDRRRLAAIAASRRTSGQNATRGPSSLGAFRDRACQAARFVERVNRSNAEAAKDICSLRFIGSIVTEIQPSFDCARFARSAQGDTGRSGS
jgi:hypothetical protein